MYLYKCENKECGNVFRSNKPEFCPKCNSLEFSSHHIKSKKKFIFIGCLILLIGVSLFYIQSDIDKNIFTEEITSNKDSKNNKKSSSKKEKIQPVSFNGGLMYTSTNLNVRKNPNITSEKLYNLKTNTPVLTSKEKSFGWILIADTENNQLGYVKSKYLSNKITSISASTNKKPKQTNKENTLTAADYFSLAYNSKGSRNSDYQYKIDNYTKCLKINPDYDRAAYNNRGYAYYKLGYYNKAISDYTKAIKLDPDYDNAYAGRGDSYFKLGKYYDAIADFNKALSLNSKKAYYHYMKGLSLRKLGSYKDAISNFTKAIRLDSNTKNYYFERAYCCSKSGLFEKNQKQIIDDYTSAINIDRK